MNHTGRLSRNCKRERCIQGRLCGTARESRRIGRPCDGARICGIDRLWDDDRLGARERVERNCTRYGCRHERSDDWLDSRANIKLNLGLEPAGRSSEHGEQLTRQV